MRTIFSTVCVLLVPLLAGCVASDEAPTASARSALSVAQCEHFQVGGRITICHATGSARNPFVVMRVSDEACIHGHSGHAGDRVAIDGDCGPNACLPVGAPVDSTLSCCPGLVNQGGTCAVADLCRDVTCPASACHVSHCNASTGQCESEAMVDGFGCNDGAACTTGDTCHAGVCTGGVSACPRGHCHEDSQGFVCEVEHDGQEEAEEEAERLRLEAEAAEAERLRLEAERLAQEEAERLAQEEAERRAQEEAQRRACLKNPETCS